MSGILEAPPSERGACFAGLRDAFSPYRANLDQSTPEKAAFVSCAQTYLRALSTYPAGSEEWLDVFSAFKQLHDKHAGSKQTSDRPVVTTRPVAENKGVTVT